MTHSLPRPPCDLHMIDHHDHTDNVWWRKTRDLTRRITNQSCYVCGLLPHSTHEDTLLFPVPVPINHTLLTLVKWTLHGWSDATLIYPWLKWKPTMVFRDPRNFSKYTNSSVVQKNVVFHLRNASNPLYVPQLCFHSPVTKHTRYHLGHTQGCKIVIKVSCGLANCENRTDHHDLIRL